MEPENLVFSIKRFCWRQSTEVLTELRRNQNLDRPIVTGDDYELVGSIDHIGSMNSGN